MVTGLTNAIEELRNSSDVDFNNSLQDLVAKANTIPKLTTISADMLMQWLGILSNGFQE